VVWAHLKKVFLLVSGIFQPLFVNGDSRALTSDNPQTLASNLPSIPVDQFLNANRHNNLNMDLETTRMGGQQPSQYGNGNWTTSRPRQRRRWGPCGGDVSRSEVARGKRKASYDAPEKTRKIQRYHEASHPEGEPYASISTTISDAGCVGFGSLQELTQSEADYMFPVHQFHHFMSEGLTGFSARENFEQPDETVTQEHRRSMHESLTSQEENFEEYLNPRERLANMFDIPRISTWQPMHSLDYGLVAQHHGHGEYFGLRQDQHDLERFIPHLEYPPERLA
jgi:hypothetical protein